MDDAEKEAKAKQLIGDVIERAWTTAFRRTIKSSNELNKAIKALYFEMTGKKLTNDEAENIPPK